MTREVDCLEAVNAAGNTGCFAGYTTNGSHVPGSYHERPGTPSASGPIGLAVDFDAENNATKLMACARLFDAYGPQLAELIYTPLGHSWKSGKKVASYDVDGGINHVHVAVPLGTFLQATKEQAMTLVIEPVSAVKRLGNDLDGWVFGDRGHVYGYGAGPYLGGWDDPTRADGNRHCVALIPTPSGNGYWLVSSYGETYAYGDAKPVGNYQSAWGAGQIVGAVPNGHNGGGVTLIRDNGNQLNLYALPA